ncbi:hypothetical protein F5X99DRAFT_425633 [Biscogniauxia marginata]|nr:hypothetical protein F5X99DRAFT_425633 [Biscogniauxia marginata]
MTDRIELERKIKERVEQLKRSSGGNKPKRVESNEPQTESSGPSQETDEIFRFRWIHLPANDLQWMNDLTMRVLNDRAPRKETRDGGSDNPEGNVRSKYDAEFDQLKSFMKRSWVEIPDASSPSRLMKPQCLKTEIPAPYSQEAKSKQIPLVDGSSKSTPGSPEEMAKEEKSTKSTPSSGSKDKINRSNECVALYMPYLNFATQVEEGKSEEEVESEEVESEEVESEEVESEEVESEEVESEEVESEEKDHLSQLNKKRDEYNDLLSLYDNKEIHGSRTLDEFYYQFNSDQGYKQKDIDKRNRDQIVTKWLHDDLGNTPTSWILLRVDQLWLWIITPDTIISSSTHRQDYREDVVNSSVSSRLKDVNSQPQSVQDLAKIIVETCIHIYDRFREAKPDTWDSHKKTHIHIGKKVDKVEKVLLTIHEIFSNSINKVALEEIELFERFTRDEEINDSHRHQSSTVKHKTSIYEPAKLLCKVKDLRDELRILRAVVSQQRDVHKILAHNDDTGPTAQILSKIEEMDKYVGRSTTQLVNATLSLEQNKLAVIYSNEAVQQGRALMVFTIATVFFLPMSFLTSLFALNVSDFQHNQEGDLYYSPQWIFPIIFCVSLAFSLPLSIYAFHDRIFPNLYPKFIVWPTEYSVHTVRYSVEPTEHATATMGIGNIIAL